MIDVKTLRIGAHIKVDGKIQKICSIDNDGIGVNIPITYKVVCGSSIISEESIYEQSYSAEEIDPIPLTAELLTEIGFKYSGESYEKREGDYYIAFDYGNKNMWRVHVFNRLVCLGNVLCRYLHEAENFVYMTLHKELIED